MFYLMLKTTGTYRKATFFTRLKVRTYCFCFIFITHSGKGVALSFVKKHGVVGGYTVPYFFLVKPKLATDFKVHSNFKLSMSDELKTWLVKIKTFRVLRKE